MLQNQRCSGSYTEPYIHSSRAKEHRHHMITNLLEVLPQEEYLSLAAKGVWWAAHQELDTYVSMTMMSVPKWYRRKNVGYCQLTYIGQAHGQLVMHLFVIGRNFLVTTHENKAEWAAVADDLLQSCAWGVRRAKRTIQAKLHQEYEHYFRFYYASNLDLAFVPSKRTKAGKQLHRTRDELDSHVRELQVPLAPDDYRTHMQMVCNDHICDFLEQDDFEEVYDTNSRFVFELRGKNVTISPALLGGIHGLAGTKAESPMQLAKASFLTGGEDAITKEALSELEMLVASKVTKEADLQRFFERFPALLCDGREYLVYPQIVFSRDDGTILRPDFFLEPMEGLLASATVLDIKRPAERLILHRKNRPRFYSKIYEYAAQLREYSRYMESPSNRKWLQGKYGIEALQPHMVLVVGKDYGEADYALVKKVQQSVFPVEVRTYGEILDYGREILEERRAAVPDAQEASGEE